MPPPTKKEFKKPKNVGKLPIKVDPVVTPESISSSIKPPTAFKVPPVVGQIPNVQTKAVNQSKVPTNPVVSSFTPAIDAVLKSQPIALPKYSSMTAGKSKVAVGAVTKDSDLKRFVRDFKGGVDALTGDDLTTGEKAKAIGSAPIKTVVGIGNSVKDFASITLPKALATGIKMIADNVNQHGEIDINNFNRSQRASFDALAPDQQEAYITKRKEGMASKDAMAGKVSEWASEVIAGYGQKQKESMAKQGITPDTSIISPKKFGYGVGQGISSIAAYVGITALTRNPAIGAVTLGWVEGSETYNTALQTFKNEGMSDNEASRKAGALALTESAGIAVLEKVGMDALFRSYAGGKMRNAAIGAITETLQESTQTVWSNGVEKYGYNETQKLYEDLFDTIITTLPVGAFGGGFSAGTDPVANIDPEVIAGEVKNTGKFEPEEVLQASEEMIQAVQDEAMSFADAMAQPDQMDEATVALYEDIASEVEMKGEEEVIAQLMDEDNSPVPMDEEEARAVVAEATKPASMADSQPPADIMADIMEAAAIVRGEQAPATTEPAKGKGLSQMTDQELSDERIRLVQNSLNQQLSKEDNPRLDMVIANLQSRGIGKTQDSVQDAKPDLEAIAEELQQEAEQVWEEKYAEKYGALAKQYDTLRKTLKQSKASEIPAVQVKLNKVNAEMQDMEQGFIDSYRAKTEEVKQEKINKAVEIVEKSITPVTIVVDENEESGTIDSNVKPSNRDTGSDIQQAGNTESVSDDSRGQTKRGSSDKVDSSSVARGKRDISGDSTGERSSDDVVDGRIEPFVTALRVAEKNLRRAERQGVDEIDTVIEEQRQALIEFHAAADKFVKDKKEYDRLLAYAKQTTTEVDLGATDLTPSYGPTTINEEAQALGFTNEEVENIIESNTTISDTKEITLDVEVTEDVLETANAWQPAGGRESEGAEGRGLLDEYYTPAPVVEMVASMLTAQGAFNKENVTVLEPSVGIGNFLYSLPENAKVTGYEVNENSARIAKINHPNATIKVQPLEEIFVDSRGNKKTVTESYDVVLGNPPYGSHRGRYKGVGEEARIKRYETYFMKRSLDLTNEGGYVAMVVPSGFMRKGIAEPGKKEMAKLGKLVSAVRLPNGTFETTDIGTDILVFKRESTNSQQEIDGRLATMSNDGYFGTNPQAVLGTNVMKSGRFGQEEAVQGDIDSAQELFHNHIGQANEMVGEVFTANDIKTIDTLMQSTVDYDGFDEDEAGSTEFFVEEEDRKLIIQKLEKQGFTFNDDFSGEGGDIYVKTATKEVAFELFDKMAIQRYGEEITQDQEGNMVLYHGTSGKKAAEIMKTELKEGSYMAVSYERELGGVSGALEYGDTILRVIVDPRSVSINGLGEFLLRDAKGVVEKESFTVPVTTDDVITISDEKVAEIANDATQPKATQEIAQREEDRRVQEQVSTDADAQKERMKELGIKLGDTVQHFNATGDYNNQYEDGVVAKKSGSKVMFVQKKDGSKTIWDENWYKVTEEVATTPTEMLDLGAETRETLKDGLWDYVSATGELQGDFDVKKAYYMKGKYYNEFNYAQGDIYQKLEWLQEDYATIGAEQYEKQKAVLEAVKPNPMTVARMRIAPHAHFTEQVMLRDKTLQAWFLEWINDLPLDAFGSTNRYAVKQYTLGESVRGGDKLQNEKERRNRRIEGDKLFKLFLTDELSKSDQATVEDEYNRRFNSYHKPDYNKVPLVSKISATYQGNPLELRSVQRQGIGFLLNKGVGLLAHDVGLGKTLQGVIANIELIERGWAKKPLVVLPSASVYQQWISDFKALKPNLKINELSNLGKDFKGDLSTLNIPEGTLSVITLDGFTSLGFTDETYKDLTKDMLDVVEQPNAGKQTKRAQEKDLAKTEETIGVAMRGTSTEITFEGLGFDAITVDEIHNYNHIIGTAKAEEGKTTEFRGFSQMPSQSGLKLWLAAQYIMRENSGRNVIGLSATPFTNHPLEYYSILSLFARDRMTQMGIRNVNDFMAMYMDVVAKDEVKADGTLGSKLDVRGFNNAQQFQALLREFIDFRDGEEVGIIRPARNSREFVVKENRMSFDYKQQAQTLFEDKKAGTLKAMTELQQIAFSPYGSRYHTGPIPSPKQFVEGSPKIKLAVELLAETYFNVKTSNHIIYSNRGKQFLPVIKSYLVTEKGIPADQIELITGDTPKAKRTTIQNAFNAGKVRVILGNEAIEEGINLQKQTTDLYMLSQPWNYTAVRQVIGRAWRQGNKWRNVRINNFFTENTFDIFLSQSIEKKRVRYQQSLQQGEDYIDAGDIDYEAMKFDLMTDPVIRTRQEYNEKRQKLDQEIRREKADFATKNRRNKDYVELLQKISQYQKYVAEDPEGSWAKNNLRDTEIKLSNLRKTLTEKGIDLASIDEDLVATEARIEALKKQEETLKEEEVTALEQAKIESAIVVDTTGTEDYKARIQERKADDRSLYLNESPMFSRKINNDTSLVESAKGKTLEQFIKEQGTIVYHGTSEGVSFTKFDPRMAQRGNRGNQIYLTESKVAADWFSKLKSQTNYLRSDEYRLNDGPNKGLDFTPNTMEFVIPKGAKIKVLEKLPQQSAEAVIEQLKQEGYAGVQFTDDVLDTIEGQPELAEAFKDGKSPNTTIVFDPETIISKAELENAWREANDPMYSTNYTKDKRGRFTGSLSREDRRAQARQAGYVPETDMALAKSDREYRLKMKARNFDEVARDIERFKKQFNINFNYELQDRIFFSNESAQSRNKIERESEAYGVYFDGVIMLTDTMPSFTGRHETIHLILDKVLGKIEAFKDFTKDGLLLSALSRATQEEINALPKEHMLKDMPKSYLGELTNGFTTLEKLSMSQRQGAEELIAYGFETYLAKSMWTKYDAETKHGKLLARFFNALKDAVQSLRNFFTSGYSDQITKFYDTVATGKGDAKTLVINSKSPYQAKVRFRTTDGLKYANFSEISAQYRQENNENKAAFFSKVFEPKDDTLMTNQVFQNKNQLNFVMKDINTLEDITAQARDIYLKDPKQFEVAKTLEDIGEAHDADKFRLDERFSNDLEPYMKLKPEHRKRVHELLWKGDEEGKEYNLGELVRMSLNDEQIAAYRAVRYSLDMAHEMLLQEMVKKGISEAEINTFREQRKGYMPHKWIPKMNAVQKLKSYVSGKEVIVVKHQVKGEETNKYETYHMDAFASEKEALQFQQHMSETVKDPRTRYVIDKLASLEVDFFASQELTSERMMAVIEQMREEKYVKDHIVELLRMNLLNMFKEKGFGRHYLRRTGVRGYDTDNTELVLADYFSGFSGYVTKMRWSSQYFLALSQVDARRQQKFYAWVRDLIAYKLNNNPEWRMARTIAFTWYLANDISYLLTNCTQNLIVGTGELSKYLTGSEKAWKPEAYLVKAMTDWATQRVTPEEKSAIDGLVERGQLGAEMTSELMGFKNNPLYNEISSRFSKVMYGSTAIVEKNINRIPAFLAARRIFIEQGMDAQMANNKALEVQNDIHFRYGRHHRPRMLRGKVNVLFIFQNYIRTFLYQLYRDASKREFISLTRKMMYTTALGGVSALPFAGMFMSVLKGIAGDEDDEELKEELSKWDILIARGIPASFGIDLSTRVGIELLTITKLSDNPTDIRTYMGAIGDMAFKRPFEIADLVGQKRYLDALAKLLPDMMANPIRAYNGYEYGVRSFAGVPLLDADGNVYKYTAWETAIKAIGFTPTQEALLWDEKAKEWDRQAQVQEERTEISRTIRGMVQREEFKEARDLQEQAIADGTISEKTDYIRQYAKQDWFSEAVQSWETSDKSRDELKTIEEGLIEKVYGGVATDLQRNNVRKELAVYRQFGQKDPNISDIMKASTNEEKVKVLLEIKDNIGATAFDELIKKGRTGIYTEAGNRVPILFSDDLMKELKVAEKINANQN